MKIEATSTFDTKTGQIATQLPDDWRQLIDQPEPDPDSRVLFQEDAAICDLDKLPHVDWPVDPPAPVVPHLEASWTFKLDRIAPSTCLLYLTEWGKTRKARAKTDVIYVQLLGRGVGADDKLVGTKLVVRTGPGKWKNKWRGVADLDVPVRPSEEWTITVSRTVERLTVQLDGPEPGSEVHVQRWPKEPLAPYRMAGARAEFGHPLNSPAQAEVGELPTVGLLTNILWTAPAGFKP